MASPPPVAKPATPGPPTLASPPLPSKSWFRKGSEPGLPSAQGSESAGGAPAGAVPPIGPPHGPPVAPLAPPSRKTARFIATETAQSGLKLAEDGKLPTLRLKEPGQEEVKQAGSSGAHPLLLFMALAFSAITTVVLLLIPSESDSPGRTGEKQAARREIEESYISGMDKEAELAPYQLHLREALQAHARRDFAEERRRYRRVLDMLRAERGKFDRGLTGSPAKDETLEKLITTLLSD